MPRVRFTVRGLMIVVAIAAVGIGGWRFSRHCRVLAADYQARADLLAFQERLSLAYGRRTRAEWLADRCEVERRNRTGTHRSGGHPLFFMEPPEPELSMRQARHFGAMRKKYERAARYPWLPVAPDPPRPE